MSLFLLIFALLRQEYVPINAFQVKPMLYGKIGGEYERIEKKRG